MWLDKWTQAVLRPFVAEDFTATPKDGLWLSSVVAAADAVAKLDWRDAARVLFEQLRYIRRPDPVPWATLYAGSELLPWTAVGNTRSPGRRSGTLRARSRHSRANQGAVGLGHDPTLVGALPLGSGRCSGSRPGPSTPTASDGHRSTTRLPSGRAAATQALNTLHGS